MKYTTVKQQRIASLTNASLKLQKLIQNVKAEESLLPEKQKGNKMYKVEYRIAVIQLVYLFGIRGTAAFTTASPASICRWVKNSDQKQYKQRPSVITDDVSADDVNVQTLFATPPSLFLLAVPHVLELSVVMRACVDYVFLFRDALALDIERLFENFAADAFASLDVFSQVLKGCTIGDEHECLVIDRKARNNVRIFWHNAGGDPPRTPRNHRARPRPSDSSEENALVGERSTWASRPATSSPSDASSEAASSSLTSLSNAEILARTDQSDCTRR